MEAADDSDFLDAIAGEALKDDLEWDVEGVRGIQAQMPRPQAGPSPTGPGDDAFEIYDASFDDEDNGEGFDLGVGEQWGDGEDLLESVADLLAEEEPPNDHGDSDDDAAAAKGMLTVPGHSRTEVFDTLLAAPKTPLGIASPVSAGAGSTPKLAGEGGPTAPPSPPLDGISDVSDAVSDISGFLSPRGSDDEDADPEPTPGPTPGLTPAKPTGVAIDTRPALVAIQPPRLEYQLARCAAYNITKKFRIINQAGGSAVAWRALTNAPSSVYVRPRRGCMAPGGSATIRVLTLAGFRPDTMRLRVEYARVGGGDAGSSAWSRVSPDDMRQFDVPAVATEGKVEESSPISVHPRVAQYVSNAHGRLGARFVLGNPGARTLAFKVLTNTPDRHVVAPTHGAIRPGGSAAIFVGAIGAPPTDADSHRLLVMFTELGSQGADAAVGENGAGLWAKRNGKPTLEWADLIVDCVCTPLSAAGAHHRSASAGPVADVPKSRRALRRSKEKHTSASPRPSQRPLRRHVRSRSGTARHRTTGDRNSTGSDFSRTAPFRFSFGEDGLPSDPSQQHTSTPGGDAAPPRKPSSARSGGHNRSRNASRGGGGGTSAIPSVAIAVDPGMKLKCNPLGKKAQRHTLKVKNIGRKDLAFRVTVTPNELPDAQGHLVVHPSAGFLAPGKKQRLILIFTPHNDIKSNAPHCVKVDAAKVSLEYMAQYPLAQDFWQSEDPKIYDSAIRKLTCTCCLLNGSKRARPRRPAAPAKRAHKGGADSASQHNMLQLLVKKLGSLGISMAEVARNPAAIDLVVRHSIAEDKAKEAAAVTATAGAGQGVSQGDDAGSTAPTPTPTAPGSVLTNVAPPVILPASGGPLIPGPPGGAFPPIAPPPLPDFLKPKNAEDTGGVSEQKTNDGQGEDSPALPQQPPSDGGTVPPPPIDGVVPSPPPGISPGGVPPPPPGISPGGVPPPPPSGPPGSIPPPPPPGVPGVALAAVAPPDKDAQLKEKLAELGIRPTEEANPTAKMKTLHWQKLEVGALKDTVFHSFLREDGDEGGAIGDLGQFDAEEFEKAFGAGAAPRSKKKKRAAAGSAARGRRGSAMGGGGTSSGSASTVNLIDTKRSRNVLIVTSRLKMDAEALVSALQSFDRATLSLESLTRVQSIFPTADEIRRVKAYRGDPSRLGPVERFFLALASDPRLRLKLAWLLFMHEFPTVESSVRETLGGVLAAVRALTGSLGLRKLLKVVLYLGNYMNAGSKKGRAYGFRMTTLMRLSSVKSSDKKTNLLRYSAELMLRNNENPSQILDELKCVQSVARVDSGHVRREVARLTQFVKTMGAALDRDEAKANEGGGNGTRSFPASVRAFQAEAADAVKSVGALLAETAEAFSSMCRYFSLDLKDPSRFEDGFAVWAGFLEHFRRALVSVLRERAARERAKKTAAQSDGKARARKRPGAGRRRRTQPGARRASRVAANVKAPASEAGGKTSKDKAVQDPGVVALRDSETAAEQTQTGAAGGKQDAKADSVTEKCGRDEGEVADDKPKGATVASEQKEESIALPPRRTRLADLTREIMDEL